MKNYGYIEPEIDYAKDWVFGAGDLQAEILQPDGHGWGIYLPPPEFQNRNAIETYACATFNTFVPLKILVKRIYSQDINPSDRYTAKITGTEVRKGNDPQKVIQSIKNEGVVPEEMWPFTKDIDTFEKYYAAPKNELAILRAIFPNQWKVNHDYVPATPKSMKEALKYSPLGASVTAWYAPDENGVYSWEKNDPNNHWTCVYDYVEGEYWMIFDSYESSKKKVAWDAKFGYVKRYSIVKAPPTDKNTPFLVALYQQLIYFLHQQLSELRVKVGGIFKQ